MHRGYRRGLHQFGGASLPPILPQSGPFASLAQTPYAGLSSTSVDGTLTVFGGDSTEASPLKYNLLEINGGSIIAYAPNGGEAVDFSVCGNVHLWVNELRVSGFSGSIHVDGGNGSDGNFTGGNGGTGFTGGSGGASMGPACPCAPGCCPIFLPGGMAASGYTGNYGSSAFCGSPGSPGEGVGAYLVLNYDYGNGETVDSVGLNGGGGGGNGGDVNSKPSGCGNFNGGGSGASGGLNCVRGNLLSGTNSFIISAIGGLGGIGGGGGFNGSRGGGGVINWGFRHKTMVGAPAHVNSYLSRIYKINPNGTETLMTWSQTW